MSGSLRHISIFAETSINRFDDNEDNVEKFNRRRGGIVAKIKSNNSGTGTTPTSRAGIDAAIKNEKTAADKYSASDDIKEDFSLEILYQVNSKYKVIIKQKDFIITNPNYNINNIEEKVIDIINDRAKNYSELLLSFSES